MPTFNPYKKRRELLVIGIEATRGVAATKRYAMRWLSKGLRSIPSILENESAMGLDTRVNDSAIDVWHSEGPLGGKVTEEGFGYLLHGMLNKVTTVNNGDGTYTHTFERDPSVARRTLSAWDVRPSGTLLYKSLYMDNLALSVEVGDNGAWLECTTALKGWKHEDVASFSPPAFATEKEFTSRMVKVLIADNVAGLANEATSRIRPRRIDISLEETSTVDHYVGEVNNDPEFDSAPPEVRGSMVVKYRSTDLEDGFFINKRHAMRIVAQNGTEKIEIEGTQVRFREVTPSDGRDETVTQTLSYYFESDLSNGGKDIVVRITNRLASFTV